MQPIALARALAAHRARRPAPVAVKTEALAPAPAKPNPLFAAIARQGRIEPRTLMEMAREREGIRHPWQ